MTESELIKGRAVIASGGARSHTNALSGAQMPIARVLALTMLFVACTKPYEREVWASNEGMRVPGSPPQFHPSQTPDATLSSRGEGALVVLVSRIPRVQVQLFPNEAWTDPVRTDSTGAAGVVVLSGLVPRTYTGLARRVGLKEQLFRISVRAGYADTLVLDPGVVGQ